jgi:hypothetical protein
VSLLTDVDRPRPLLPGPPFPFFQASLMAFKWLVKALVVPLLSALRTTVTGRSGR